MSEDQIQVDYLKKITLELTTGTSPDKMDLCSTPTPYAFIYGVATEGITLFEKALFSKSIGDEIVCHLENNSAAKHLGHLQQSIMCLLPKAPEFFLKARITGISRAEQREVVRAIAAGTSAGGGCDCGGGGDCGCGC